ncbi:cell wall-active antibiotics response protein LiaF [Amphibacillus sp. Q70]|uniref:cell wall-active antibiotics response protein LiaF n=1 Tax=Amphibacillus sp. Q70 TaxID=3453416 RepID=UPI003F84E244
MGSRFFRTIIAIFIILVGVILVLENLDIVTWSIGDWWYYIYPSFFILIGLKWIYQAFKGFNGYGTPLFLIIFGSLLLADRFNYLTFGFWDIYKLWPLILIFIGLYFLGIPQRRRFKVFSDTNDSETYSNRWKKRDKVIIGDYNYNTTNWKVEPIDIWNAVGDHTMDFTKAFIPDENTPITIHGLAGDINIILPDHVDFSIRATVHAGEIVLLDQTTQGINRVLTYQTADYETATRKLTFNLKLNAGSIRVDRI